MIVAGVDPSLTSAGVAVLRDGKPVHVSHHGHPGRKQDSYRIRSRRVRKQVNDVMRAVMSEGRPNLAVIEEHPYAIRISAGEFDRSALWHGVFGALDHAGVPVVVMNNSTAKKWITGRGDAKKPDIIAAVQAWWPDLDIACDDEADSLGLAAIGAFHLGEEMPFPVKDRHTLGLEKVSWP